MSSANNLRKGLSGFARLKAQDKAWVVRDLGRDPKISEIVVNDLARALSDRLHGASMMPHVFLSHSSKDKRFVRALAHRLKRAGIHIWLDEAEMKVGQSLIAKLRDAVDAVDFLIVILSKASVESAWVQKEVELAMIEEIANRKVKVLPILKETVALPGFLQGKIYIDFRNKGARAKSTEKLIQDILSHRRDEQFLGTSLANAIKALDKK